MTGSTIYNILALAAYLLPMGYDDMHPNQKRHITSFIAKNFGNSSVKDGLMILRDITEQNNILRTNGREDLIYSNLRDIGSLLSEASYESRMGLLAFYIGIAIEDGDCSNIEIERLHNIAMVLGLEQEEVDIIISLLQPQAEDPKIAALKVLGLAQNATDKDIKDAYRRLSLQFHPDRNLDKSYAEQKIAERKFKEIVAAKETLDNILHR